MALPRSHLLHRTLQRKSYHWKAKRLMERKTDNVGDVYMVVCVFKSSSGNKTK